MSTRLALKLPKVVALRLVPRQNLKPKLRYRRCNLSFEVTALNLVRLGIETSEVNIRVAAKLKLLAATTTPVNTNLNVTIT